jgi:hypothetical protein
MYEDNKWYGHRYILLRYLNIKKDQHVFAQIQHGWYGSKSSAWVNKSKSLFNRMVPTLAWYRHYDRNDKANIISIGAPFLYLDKICKKKKIKENGTLFIPSHSRDDSENIRPYHHQGWKHFDNKGNKIVYKINLNLLHYATQIEKKYSSPYTVCFHPADYKNKNYIEFFKKRGWQVIVAVGREDNQSLFKMRRLLLSHKNIIFSDFTSSALLYAMYLKKTVKVFNYKKDIEVINFEKKNEGIFSNYQNKKIAFKIAKNELGYIFFKRKIELKKILGLNNPIKNIIAKFVGVYRDYKYKLK